MVSYERKMSLKSLIVIVSLAVLPFVGTAAPALAQTSPASQPSDPALPAAPRVRRHIEITPRPLLYRRCTDWYELQYRPSGTVLFPQKRCWWVRG
jgi:hypothetical protein